MQQTLQGLGFDQRHIAVENQHALGREVRQRLRHCMTGSQLLGLNDEIEIITGQALTHLLGAVADHYLDAARLQRARSGDDVAKHGLAGDRMQHLGSAERMRVPCPAARMTISRDMKRFLNGIGATALRPLRAVQGVFTDE